MTRPSHYAEAWNDYRKRRLVFAAVLLSYVPGVWLVAVPLSSLTGIKSDYLRYPAAGAWMLAFLITSARLTLFHAPAVASISLRAGGFTIHSRAGVCTVTFRSGRHQADILFTGNTPIASSPHERSHMRDCCNGIPGCCCAHAGYACL
jgi:hypothetical protein